MRATTTTTTTTVTILFTVFCVIMTRATVQSEQVVAKEDPLLPWDSIRLTAASCQEGPTYSRFLPPNADSITPQEECNTCSGIVRNMNRWNWQKHYSSMCVGMPRHLLDLCKHYACKMAIQCPEFISNKCVVDGYERYVFCHPHCPTKYLRKTHFLTFSPALPHPPPILQFPLPDQIFMLELSGYVCLLFVCLFRSSQHHTHSYNFFCV